MDAVDQKIITLLNENSRLAASQIAEKVHLSVPAVTERVRKLKESGIIERFTLQLNREKLGLSLLAFVFVAVAGTQYIPAFLERIGAEKMVLECHHIAGEYDYLLKVAAQGTKELEHLVSAVLKGIPGVARTNTVIVMSTIKEEW